MRDLGLVDEVSGLLDKGFRQGLTAQAAIGYKEIVMALDGLITMDDAFEQVKQATRRYSKRQRTWLRSEDGLMRIDADDLSCDELVDKALKIISSQSGL